LENFGFKLSLCDVREAHDGSAIGILDVFGAAYLGPVRRRGISSLAAHNHLGAVERRRKGGGGNCNILACSNKVFSLLLNKEYDAHRGFNPILQHTWQRGERKMLNIYYILYALVHFNIDCRNRKGKESNCHDVPLQTPADHFY
jgi:hypothetical protein